MTGAFSYLAFCSIQNLIRLRVRRLRRPRYILITIGMGLWLANAIFNRPPAGLLRIKPEWSGRAQIISLAVAFAVLALCWVMPGARSLGLTAAEIQFLLPAPITRRQLIGYKLWRLLIPAFSTSLLLTLFIAPDGAGPAAGFAARTFLVMAMLALYEAAVSLHRKASEDGTPLYGSEWARIALVAAAITVVLAWVLTRIALAPVGELTQIVPLALTMLGVTTTWVLGSDAAFEEAATEAADRAERGKLPAVVRPRRPARRSSPFPLALKGRFETAILWKNWMLIGRASRPVLMVGGVVFLTVVGMTAWIGAMFETALVPSICFAAAAFIVLLGPAMLRIDLRHDLAHLVVFKTWPVRGAAVVRAELLAPFIALALTLPVPLLVGSLFDRDFVFGPDATLLSRAAFAAMTVLVGSALILAQLVIQNGLAVTFPGWMHLSPTGVDAGMDVMGQSMITMYGGMLVLGFALIPPLVAGGAIWFVFGGQVSPGAMLLPALVFSAVLLLECVVSTELIGRIFERADLQDVAVSE